MQGIKRKVVYVSLYESIAILCTSVVFYSMGFSVFDSWVVSVAASGIAVLWNLAWNTLFEYWEARQSKKGRSLRRRIVHALGFEGGLVVFLVPFFAWWLSVPLWEAFMLDAGLLAFFLVYTFVFTRAFDHAFGLPASAISSFD
ncbi:MAG: PACE efflux transporter [Pusillimonas sp.]|nr:PACE efflux transporter [Pusillimonas sp.]